MLRANVPGLGRIFVCGLYRPPSRSVADFFTKLEQLLVHCGNSRTIVAGDLNLDLLKSEHYPVKKSV